jgi:hypothetical protein
MLSGKSTLDNNMLFYSNVLSALFFSHSNIRSDIFRLENLSVWQFPVLRYSLLMRNQGYIEFETLKKPHWLYLRNTKTAINYLFKRLTHNLPIFLTGKIWLNIGICQTLGFSFLKMSSQG